MGVVISTIRYESSLTRLTRQLFWENLTPAKHYEDPSGGIKNAIDAEYGSLDKFKESFNTALNGIQGSGWGWLIKKGGQLQIITTPVRLISSELI